MNNLMKKKKQKKNKNKLLFSIILLLLFLFKTTMSSSDGGREEEEEESSARVGEEYCPNMSRRALWEGSPSNPGTEKRYISYEALKGDNVPCSRPGVPYYNCHVLPKANPYARGCSVITACRG